MVSRSADPFCADAVSASAPTTMPSMPQKSTMCGGLTIFTSRPYALCHQLSNGADTSIAKVPQMVIHAPIGPRNPQKCTVAALSSFPNVVRSTTAPHATPAQIALTYSSTCGGVQNESRPTVMCHEMSQSRPVTIPAALATMVAMNLFEDAAGAAVLVVMWSF